jgi:hypothetical protein
VLNNILIEKLVRLIKMCLTKRICMIFSYPKRSKTRRLFIAPAFQHSFKI